MQGYAWHQEQPPPYPTIRHSQAQFNPQPYSTEHAPRHFSKQQELNRRSDPQAIRSGNADAFAFQQNPGRCDGQTNQTSPQQRFTGYQQHYMPSRVATHNTERQASDNPNSQIQYANLNHQSCLYVNSQQNYSMTGSSTTHVVPGQAQVHSTQRSDRESCITVTDNNRWHLGSNISNNGRSCQQPQARPTDYYPQHLQQQSGHYSGQQQMLGQPLQSNPCIQNSPMNLRITNHEAQSRTAVMYTLHNSVTLPSAGPPSNNFQQSQTELRSNASPDVPTAQSQDNQRSARRPTPDANGKTYNINQNHIHQQAPVQYNPTSRPPHFHMEAYVHSKLYEMVNSKQANFHSGSPTNTQPPDAGVQNRAANKTKHYSNLKQLYADVLPTASEPPNKRMNYGVTRRKYWNKPSQNTKKSMSEDDTGQTRQSEIQYITDSAECLEAVFALQKVFQPVQKAVAIVPPISQQTSNTEKVDNTSPKPVDSPPLKIDAVWSLAKESEPHNPSAEEIKDKLFEDSSPVVEQDDKICPESKTEPQNLSAKEIKYNLSQDFSPKLQQDDKVSPEKANNIADPCITESPNTCSGNPKTDHQNDNQQSDSDSSDNAFDLSNVPVVTHTLEDLRSLVLSLETTESSAENTERPESVSDQILNLYWNGDTENLIKHAHELDKVRRYSYIDSVKNDTSVVFESITPENLKKVAYCEIVNKEICSLSKEFRSSWLNVDGQPADINKLLSEPLPDYITLSKCTSDASINANEMQSVKPDCEYPADTFTPSTGNVMKKVVTGNKVHSDAKIPGVTSLHNVPSEQETESEKQGDNTQNHKHLNTKLITDLSPLAHIQSTEQKDGTTTETLSQEHLKDKQEHDLIPAQKLSVPLTEKQVNEQPQNNFPCSNPINIVKNISDDERLDKMEVSTNSTDTIQVENMSDDENSSNMEAISNTDTRHMKDISDYDSSSNIKALTKSTDKVEDISSDENPSNESLLMDITVLSSEDALNFFQLLEKEPQCDIIAESNVVCPELVASSSEPNNEHNKVKNCSRCGTSIIVTPNSNDVTKTDNGGEVCPPCWNTAPLLNLETEVRNETNVLCSPTKSVQMCINDSLPSLKPIVHEKVVASTEEDNANEELKETTKEDSLVNSVPDSSCNETPEIQKNVEQECTKIQPDEAKDENIPSFFLLMQCNNPPPLKPSVPDTSTSKTIEIKNNVEQKLTKIQPAEAKNNSPETLNISSSFLIMQCNNPPPSKPSVPDTSTSKTIEIKNNVEQKLTKIQPAEAKNNSPETLNISSSFLIMQCNNPPPSKPSVPDTSTSKTIKIKSNVEQELTKIQPDEAKDETSENVNVSSFHLQMELNNPPTSKSSDIIDSKKPKKTSESEPQSNNPPPSKSAFLKRKLKSSNAEVASDECVLFTPDIVLKKNHPQKKNHSSGHLSLSVKHVTEPSQETQDPPLQAVTDRTLQDHKEKVTEKASSFSNKTFVTTALHRSNSMPEMEGEKLTVKKLTIQKNNIKFALYGSKGEQQCATQERRFSPPATLTVSSFKTYSDVVSAKQKVHNQWSSSFIPKVKKKSPQKREKTKKKPLKPQEVLRSNMAALKEQLKHRTMLLSSQDIEQKRTQTLNG